MMASVRSKGTGAWSRRGRPSTRCVQLCDVRHQIRPRAPSNGATVAGTRSRHAVLHRLTPSHRDRPALPRNHARPTVGSRAPARRPFGRPCGGPRARVRDTQEEPAARGRPRAEPMSGAFRGVLGPDADRAAPSRTGRACRRGRCQWRGRGMSGHMPKNRTPRPSTERRPEEADQVAASIRNREARVTKSHLA